MKKKKLAKLAKDLIKEIIRNYKNCEEIKNTRDLYKTRNDIINVFKTVKSEYLETLGGAEPDIFWLYRPESELNVLIEKTPFEYLKEDKNYVSFVKNLRAFLKKVLENRFKNKKKAKDEYFAKLGVYAEKYNKPKEKINPEDRTIRARDLINQLEYILFGFDNTKQTPETEKLDEEKDFGKRLAAEAMLELGDK